MTRNKLTILFVHKDFPSQFHGLVSHFLKRPDTMVAAICEQSGSAFISGVQYSPYPKPEIAKSNVHPFTVNFDQHVRRGAAALEAAKRLKESGIVPDIIYAHPGWGEALFLSEIFPQAKRVVYCEHYYRMQGADVFFDPEFPPPPYLSPMLTIQNTPTLLGLNDSHAAVSPTYWQRDGFPSHWQDKIQVIHEGVDTDLVKPDPRASFTLPNGTTLHAGDEVVTYLSRDLEPYRGFHTFCRALPRLLKLRPHATVLIAGRNGPGYGPNPPDGEQGWVSKYLRENPIDHERVHFLGTLPYPAFVKALQVSACHVYLTYPFVLSWSLVEAMAAGCLVVGSSTPPLAEVIEHGRNGLLADFFDAQALADLVAEVLARPADVIPLRRLARETAVQRFDRTKVCLPAHLQLAENLLQTGGVL